MTSSSFSSSLSLSGELSRLEDYLNTSSDYSVKRQCGKDADEIFALVIKELRVMLDQTHADKEKVPEPDLWCDAGESLRYWAETLEIFAEQFDAIAKKAYAALEIEDQKMLPR